MQNLTGEQVRQIAREQSLLVEKMKFEAIDPEIDTALRRFRAGSYLQYAYTIYNAKRGGGGGGAPPPQLETQMRIFRDGKLVLEGKPQSPEDAAAAATGQTADLERIKFNGALMLPADLPPGNYVLQIIVRDSLAEAERQVAAAQWADFEIIK